MRRIRPIVKLESQLGEIPRDWLIFIEPYVAREGFLPCWIWTKTLDERGFPIISIPYYKSRGRKIYKLWSVRKFIMRMFYEFDESALVVRVCSNASCINPSHMVIYEADKHNNKVRAAIRNGIAARNSSELELTKDALRMLLRS